MLKWILHIYSFISYLTNPQAISCTRTTPPRGDVRVRAQFRDVMITLTYNKTTSVDPECILNILDGTRYHRVRFKDNWSYEFMSHRRIHYVFRGEQEMHLTPEMKKHLAEHMETEDKSEDDYVHYESPDGEILSLRISLEELWPMSVSVKLTEVAAFTGIARSMKATLTPVAISPAALLVKTNKCVAPDGTSVLVLKE